MDFEEFQQVIVPLALKIGYMPETLSPEIQRNFTADLYNASRKAEHSWEAQSFMFDTWGTLNLDFKYLVESVIALMKNYEHIQEWESQGVSRVKLVCYKPLPQCPDGEYVPLKDVSNGFKSSGSSGVVVPRLDCPRNILDGGGLCGCTLIPASEIPETISWIREILE